MTALTETTAAEAPLLTREDADGVATLTLNRPDKFNALSVALLSALQDQLDAIGADSSVKVVVLAANFAAGGDMDDVKPGLAYIAKLHKSGNVLRNVGTTPYAQFLKGEIPIWIGYENDGLKAKYTDGMGDDVAIVIPKEA